MKNHITIIVLAIVSIAECIFTHDMGRSVLLWFLYGLWKLETYGK